MTMQFLRPILVVLLILIAPQAFAADGFVIESNSANLVVGVPIDETTTISVAAGGHLVILTSSGQMLRRNGPFVGTGAGALGPAAVAKSGGAAASTIDALVDLAVERGTAQNRVFASRGNIQGIAGRPFSITPETQTYCHRADIAPAFALSQPPTRDLPLLLHRTSRPRASHDAYWPAGQPNFAWPRDWPSLETGTYEWSAGYVHGAFIVKIISARADPSDPIAVAEELTRLGCGDQAWISLKEAITRAPTLD